MYTLLLFAAIATIITVWVLAIYDISTSHFEKRSHSLLWLLFVLAFPIVGSVVYFMIRKDIKTKPRAFDPGFRHS